MSLTITTWNVQNFSRNDPVFADKLNFLTLTLQAIGSDIVALEEILDQGALQDLANKLGRNKGVAHLEGSVKRATHPVHPSCCQWGGLGDRGVSRLFTCVTSRTPVVFIGIVGSTLSRHRTQRRQGCDSDSQLRQRERDMHTPPQ